MLYRFEVKGWICYSQFHQHAESQKQNWVAELVVLFESVITLWWFLRTLIMLFLTKIDIFKSKLLKCIVCTSATITPS